jgi:hypothetical protein
VTVRSFEKDLAIKSKLVIADKNSQMQVGRRGWHVDSNSVSVQPIPVRSVTKMSESCSKVQQKKIGAAYVLGQLVIWAEGDKPRPCHRVRIERWSFRIYPPQYQIVACVDGGVICPEVITPYKTVAAFSVPEETFAAMDGVAIVHHAGGAERVPVQVIDIPERSRKLAAGASAFGGGGEMPFPFVFSKLLETGRAEDIQLSEAEGASLHTATGYSNTFSFTEAFQDAVANLPPDPHPFPDKLTNVSVIAIGGNFGGIAGLHRLFVTVTAYY